MNRKLYDPCDVCDPSDSCINCVLGAYRALGTVEELTRGAALIKAQDEGRVVVLPERAIAARYDVADMLQDDLKEASFSDPSVGIFGLTWAESESWQAVIDGLNQGRAEAEAALGGGGDG